MVIDHEKTTTPFEQFSHGSPENQIGPLEKWKLIDSTPWVYQLG